MSIVRAGSTLLLAEPPLNKPHLWVVLTDPDSEGRVVAVMLRTATRFTDETLMLQPGDHPFVRHETSVHYSTARWFAVPALDDAMKRGRCHMRDEVSPELLARCCDGLLRSPFTVHAVAEFCRSCWKR